MMPFATPEASVAGISQCSQPCVCAIGATQFAIPPTGKPISSKSLINGSILDSSENMNSTLFRIVKRMNPSAY